MLGVRAIACLQASLTHVASEIEYALTRILLSSEPATHNDDTSD
jgi:hypothetical protein